MRIDMSSKWRPLIGNLTAIAVAAIVVGISATECAAFGPRGHAKVGAISDALLKGTPTAMKLAALLDGMSLTDAALLADTIKSSDTHPDHFHLAGHPRIQQELRDFLKANKVGSAFNHHDFHYTDVPVEGSSKYHPGSVGRSDHDVVNMISYCIKVLNGTEPPTNARKITTSVAVIMLAHYIGDIHQPLHVGAEYFDSTGSTVNPDTAGTGIPDKGGDGLTLVLLHPAGVAGNLHSYWDAKAVDGAFDLYISQIVMSGGTDTTDKGITSFLAGKTPGGTLTSTTPIEKWSEEWANEMLPTARAAHGKLKFSNVVIHGTTTKQATAVATERPPGSGSPSYAEFAAQTTALNIHRAGWRLKIVLETVLP